jgi:hypothetical protein
VGAGVTTHHIPSHDAAFDASLQPKRPSVECARTLISGKEAAANPVGEGNDAYRSGHKGADEKREDQP